MTEAWEKKIWNRVHCQCSGKGQKTRKLLKITLFNWTKEDKMRDFSRNSSFSKLSTSWEKPLTAVISGRNTNSSNYESKSESLFTAHATLRWRGLGKRTKLNELGRHKLERLNFWLLVNWCFEPSQPRRIVVGLICGSNRSMQSYILTYSRLYRGMFW